MKTVNDKIQILKGRIVLAVLMILCSVEFVSAAGNGLSGINEATTMVTSYFEPGVKLIYAIGAVVGLIGGAATPTQARQPLHGSGRVSF